jgi:acyl carrier protein
MAVREELRAFVSNNFYARDLDDDTSLVETGTMDSTGVLEVIYFLEERFGIQIVDAEIHQKNFETLGRIDAFLTRKLDDLRQAAAP